MGLFGHGLPDVLAAADARTEGGTVSGYRVRDPQRYGVKAKGIEVVVFEPALEDEQFFGSRVQRDLGKFKRDADVIVTNRRSSELADVEEKIFTRGLFGSHCVGTVLDRLCRVPVN